MNGIGRDIDERARLGLERGACDITDERTLENEYPLLIRMGVRVRAGAGCHSRQREHHPVTFDARSRCGRIVGTNLELIEPGEIEQVFTRPRAPCARSSWSRLLSHGCDLHVDQTHRICMNYSEVVPASKRDSRHCPVCRTSMSRALNGRASYWPSVVLEIAEQPRMKFATHEVTLARH
jgi:hypothetical protein